MTSKNFSGSHLSTSTKPHRSHHSVDNRSKRSVKTSHPAQSSNSHSPILKMPPKEFYQYEDRYYERRPTLYQVTYYSDLSSIIRVLFYIRSGFTNPKLKSPTTHIYLSTWRLYCLTFGFDQSQRMISKFFLLIGCGRR